ncbi:hypothetical protein TNCV_3889661 [Trichonephila clavipes]|nr:hypothetical protein TNCV_3889661 [Trichonephila clavipes]
MVRRKKSASNPRKNITLNTEKKAVFTTKQYSVFAEEAIQFTVNGRNILMEKKKRSVNPPYSSVMKVVNPFRKTYPKMFRKISRTASKTNGSLMPSPVKATGGPDWFCRGWFYGFSVSVFFETGGFSFTAVA